MNQTTILLNINKFITIKKIKQSAIAKRTGINKDKLSRILNKKQDSSIPDLVSIAKALGQDISTFMESFEIKNEEITINALPQPSFYMGQVTEQRKLDSKLYSQLAERIHYIKTVATLKPTVIPDF